MICSTSASCAATTGPLGNTVIRFESGNFVMSCCDFKLFIVSWVSLELQYFLLTSMSNIKAGKCTRENLNSFLELPLSDFL